MAKPQVFSIPALKRLPAYLRELKKLQAAGRLHATSPVLAARSGSTRSACAKTSK